jgi:hypothetical protein
MLWDLLEVPNDIGDIRENLIEWICGLPSQAEHDAQVIAEYERRKKEEQCSAT